MLGKSSEKSWGTGTTPPCHVNVYSRVCTTHGGSVCGHAFAHVCLYNTVARYRCMCGWVGVLSLINTRWLNSVVNRNVVLRRMTVLSLILHFWHIKSVPLSFILLHICIHDKNTYNMVWPNNELIARLIKHHDLSISIYPRTRRNRIVRWANRIQQMSLEHYQKILRKASRTYKGMHECANQSAVL